MARESDPLLPSQARRNEPALSTPALAVLAITGLVGGIVAGWAFASIFVLFARSLDLMARATTEGADEIIQSYIRLIVIASIGKLLQYACYSWMLTCGGQGKPASEQDVHVAKAALLATQVVTTSCAITAVVLSFKHDAKMTLCAFALVFCHGIFTMYWQWRSRREMPRVVDDEEQLKEMAVKDRVAMFWDCAKLDASKTSLSKLHGLFITQEGIIERYPALLAVPLLLVFPYVVSKIDSDPACATGHCGVAVNLAVACFAMFSCARASRKWGQELTLPTREPVEIVDENAKAQAIAWTATFAKSHQPSSLWTLFSTVMTVVELARFFIIPYTIVWLFNAPATGGADVWTVVAAAAGGIVLVSVTSQFSVHKLQPIASKIKQALVIELITARMNTPQDDQEQWPTVDSSKLLENANKLGLVAAIQNPLRRWSSVSVDVLSVTAAFVIDPYFAGAVVAERIFAQAPSGWKALQLRGIRVPGTEKWFILCVLDSVLRCIAHGAPMVAALALLYVQIQWVAQGTSSFLSTLVVIFILTYGVDFFERSGPERFLDANAITAILQFKKILSSTHNQSMPIAEANPEDALK